MTDPQPTTANTAAPARPPEKPGVLNGVLLAAAVLALGIAVSTWFVASREINSMRSDLAALQEAHRELAAQVTQGRRGGGPAGQIIDVAGAPAQGPQDAVVALVEFSDYECPFCIRHFQQTMPRLEANYVRTGKLRYIFRDFPIDQLHPQAIRAHEASRCALEQNRFWELHVRLFSPPGTHTPIALEDRAREAGLNEAAFRACIASGRTNQPVRNSAAVVDALGATGTPWFFLGVRDPKTEKVRIVKSIGGAQPYEQFALAIDALLRETAAR